MNLYGRTHPLPVDLGAQAVFRAPAQPLIQAWQVEKTFGSGELVTRVLDRVSFVLPRGQLTLLMGPSGSGKTTMVSILAGTMRATSGVVELCGARISEMSDRKIAEVRRKHVGFVFQSPNLFPALDATENVAHILRLKGMSKPAAQARAHEMLVRVGLDKRLHHMPSSLSGGQKQRVAIARALADNPQLLIGDEITSALDSESTTAVMDLIRGSLTPAMSALLVTHDRRLVQYADRVVEMEDGRIVADEAGGWAESPLSWRGR